MSIREQAGPLRVPKTFKVSVEREIPVLSYELIEANLKHLQGKILTLIEATMPDLRQQKAAKDLVRVCFNDQLTWLFDCYGAKENGSIPDYSPVGFENFPGSDNSEQLS